MEAGYQWHRRWIVRIALVAIASVCVVYFANRSDVTTGATQADIAATPLPADVAVIDAQVDEISRSQDRFQQAILGIAAFAAAGMVALIGFNFYATNRNVDRESAYLRDRAQMSAREEADKARTTFEETLELASTSLREQVDSHVENASQALDGAMRKESAQFREQVKKEVEEHESTLRSQRDKLHQVAMEFHTKRQVAESQMANDRAASNQNLAETLRMLIEVLTLQAKAAEGDAADGLWSGVFSRSVQLLEVAGRPGASSPQYGFVGQALSSALEAVRSHTRDVEVRQWASYEWLLQATDTVDKRKYRQFLSDLDSEFGEQRLTESLGNDAN